MSKAKINQQWEELKQIVIELSNNLEISDGELLDLIFDCVSIKTLNNTLNKLKQWETNKNKSL